MSPRRERPIKRVSKITGKVTWEARYTNSKGKRESAGTFSLKRVAQDAIDRAYGQPEVADVTVGSYFGGKPAWLERHPRSEPTIETNERRVKAVLGVQVEGVLFEDWPLLALRRRHINDLVDYLLRRGRAVSTVQGIVRVLSAMFEDAITDDLAETNPAKGVHVRASDPRVRKGRRPIRVWSWEEMHAFAKAAAEVRTGKKEPCPMDKWREVYAEPMVRTFCDGLARRSEVLALERKHLSDGVFTLKQTAWKGRVVPGTKRDRMKGGDIKGREVPGPPTLLRMIAALPPRLDTRLLFPTCTGKLWQERNFYRDVWYPAQDHCGMDIRPHEMRHSAITLLKADGVDEADLAEIAGHSLATMISTYVHPMGASFEAVRRAIG